MQSVVRLILAAALVATVPAWAEQELPVYPGAVHTRIGNDLVILGEHYRMAYFTTKDSPETVAKYFNWFWKRRGIPTFVDGDFKQEGMVSAYYTREGLQRAVILRVHQGKTVGFSVLRDLWVRAQKKADIPSPEGALFASDVFDRDDPNNWTRSMLIEDNLSTARASTEHLLTAEGFAKHGEKVVPIENGGQRVIVEHKRGAVEVVTTYIDVEGALTAVQQSRRGAGANPEAKKGQVAAAKAEERKR